MAAKADLLRSASKYYFTLYHTPVLQWRIQVLHLLRHEWLDIAVADDLDECLRLFLMHMGRLQEGFGYPVEDQPYFSKED